VELRGKLRARGYALDQIEPLLQSLRDRNLLSDARMAECYVASRLERGFGPLHIRQALRKRGISDLLIEQFLGVYSQEDWLAQMTQVVEKKFGTHRPRNRQERARRIRFLQYRGFPPALIHHFL